MLRAPVVVALLLAFAPPLPTTAVSEGGPFVREDVTIGGANNTPIAATLWIPVGAGPFPAVVLAHGFGGARADLASVAQRYASRGWVSLAYDARGFGQSGGQVELDGPLEVADVSLLLDHLAARTDVRLDAAGDPRVALRGGSYGGAIQLLAAAADARIDALVPEITWNDLAYSLFPNDVYKLGWTTLFYLVGTGSSHGLVGGNPNPGGMDPTLTRYFATLTATQELTPEIRHYLAERSPATRRDRIHAPTLLIQGFRDTLFTPDEAAWTRNALVDQGVAARLVLYRGGHGQDAKLPAQEKAALEDRIDAWLAYWLEGDGDPEAIWGSPVEWWSGERGAFLAEQSWPPADLASLVYYLRPAEPQGDGWLEPAPVEVAARSVLASGGLTSYSALPGLQSDLPTRGMDAPVSTASFTSAPLNASVALLGSPRLHLWAATSAPDVKLYLKLFEVAPDGTATLIDDQVTPARLAGPDPTLSLPRPLVVNLTSVGVTIEQGHRLRIVVATSDPGFAENRVPGATSLVADGSRPARLELPLVNPLRATDRTPPAVQILRVEPGAANATLHARITDDVGVASANLFWRGPDAWGAATPFDSDGGTHTFRLPAAAAPVDVWVRAADAAGNANSTSKRTLLPEGEAPAARPVPATAGTAAILLLALAAALGFSRARR